MEQFDSDAFGFRNESSDYRQSPAPDVILLGDSFGEGSNATQEDILSSVLARDYGYRTYNLSMSAAGPLEEYVNIFVTSTVSPDGPLRGLIPQT